MPGSPLLTRKHGPMRLALSSGGTWRVSRTDSGVAWTMKRVSAMPQRAMEGALRDAADALAGQRAIAQQPGRHPGADAARIASAARP